MFHFTGASPYVVEVYQLALSTRAFEFLNEIRKQVNTEGSIFDPPPSFIRGNLYNPDDPDDVVLGYFMVAGSSKNSVAIDRSKTGLTPRPYETIMPKPIYVVTRVTSRVLRGRVENVESHLVRRSAITFRKDKRSTGCMASPLQSMPRIKTKRERFRSLLAKHIIS